MGINAETGEVVELLQALIRNECVNDGDIASGEEVRNSQLLENYLTPDCDVEVFEPYPGRGSVVARIEGTDPDAPKICLMGHLDVVPVNPDGWDENPFGGELIGDEVWGRGAVDMLNLTSSMAVTFRRLAAEKYRPKGDLIFFGVADEEAGGNYGAKWFSENSWDTIACDYMLTEMGGFTSQSVNGPVIVMMVAEKGVDWREITVHGTPGHGSMPFRSDNALVRASEVIRRLADYRPAAYMDDLWEQYLDTMQLTPELKAALLDPHEIWDACEQLPNAGQAGFLHACTHTTFSPNVVSGGQKTNMIPDSVKIVVDIRTVPGDDIAAVDAHLSEALGDLAKHVTITQQYHAPASRSKTDTALWDAMKDTVNDRFPGTPILPRMLVGSTDSGFFRDHGTVAYGAGLFSPSVSVEEFASRFHGHNERIDLESLQLTTEFWDSVIRRMQD